MKNSLLIIMIMISMISACHSHSQNEHANPVAFNNGARWAANKETTEGIHKMYALVESLPANAELKDYHALHETLKNELNLIFKQCTMKGEAHDQLHNYLIPLQKNIKNLASQDIAFCSKSVIELKEYLKKYDGYFQ